MQSHIFLLVIILCCSIVLTGCGTSETTAPPELTSPVEKVGDTLLTGAVFVQSGKVYLKNSVEKPQETIEIDSYSVDLQSFSGKKVQVKGQYSGDTLFLSEIQEIE